MHAQPPPHPARPHLDAGHAHGVVGAREEHLRDAGEPPAGDVDDLGVEHVSGKEQIVFGQPALAAGRHDLRPRYRKLHVVVLEGEDRGEVDHRTHAPVSADRQAPHGRVVGAECDRQVDEPAHGLAFDGSNV